MHSVYYNKVLYPSAAVDCEYTEIDKHACAFLRTLLRLPKNTPSVLLHCELRLAPAAIQATRRSLRFIAKLTRHSWIIRHVVLILISQNRIDALDRLFAAGPLRRLYDLLLQHRITLIPTTRRSADFDTNNYVIWRELYHLIQEDEGLLQYKRATQTVYSAMFSAWVVTKLQQRDYGPVLQERLSESLCTDPIYILPRYITLSGRLSSVALRHKIPGLRYIHDRSTLPQCHWCQANSEETSIHLLYCQYQPPGNQLRIQRLIGAISAEAQCNPADHELMRTYLTKLDWPGLTVDTIQELLRVISVVIEQYRTSAQNAVGDVDILASTIHQLLL
jgi:hypothetical protein